jgi:hypothetical protein
MADWVSDDKLSDQAASELNGNYFTQGLSGTGSRLSIGVQI